LANRVGEGNARTAAPPEKPSDQRRLTVGARQGAIRWRTIIAGLPAKDGLEILLILCPYVRQVDIAEHSKRPFSMFL
jgi:hypothetical protein